MTFPSSELWKHYMHGWLDSGFSLWRLDLTVDPSWGAPCQTSLSAQQASLDGFTLLDIMWTHNFLNFTSCACYSVSFLTIPLISMRLTHTESLRTLFSPHLQFILKSRFFFRNVSVFLLLLSFSKAAILIYF